MVVYCSKQILTRTCDDENRLGVSKGVSTVPVPIEVRLILPFCACYLNYVVAFLVRALTQLWVCSSIITAQSSLTSATPSRASLIPLKYRSSIPGALLKLLPSPPGTAYEVDIPRVSCSLSCIVVPLPHCYHFSAPWILLAYF